MKRESVIDHIEFVSYTPIEPKPGKESLLGIVTTTVFGDLILRFKHVRAKSGGDFFTSASYAVEEHVGEPKYIPCAEIDSKIQNERLDRLLRDGMKASALKASLASTAQVTSHEQLPF